MADPSSEHIRRWGRRKPSPPEDHYDDGCLRVEHDAYYAACQGRLISLTKTEFLLFSRLARSLGRTVPTEELWVYVWGRRKRPDPDGLHVFIYRMRRKLAPFGLRIRNLIGVGYSLCHGECCGRAKEAGDATSAARPPRQLREVWPGKVSR